MRSIQELKSIWKENKEFYKKREIGSGVHSFISNIFESDEFFNLKKYASKKMGIGEFVQDTHEGKTGRPDFILYLNNNIIIPCEAKCYTRINEGENQLFGYQLEWDKKYGILTDGYTWRFYNNSVFKELNIEQILNNPSLFKTFWNDYTKPEHYYLSFFEKQGRLSLFDNEEILKVEDNRKLFFEDITKLIRNFKNKLNIEGYFLETEQKEKERKATEISYAYFIQFILFKTLVDNCFDNYEQEFQDRVETIYKSLKAESYNGILNHISSISNFISNKLYKPFNEEQNYISDKLQEVLNKPKNDLDDISLWLDIIVFIKKYNFTNIKNDIFGFIYENYLKELYEDTHKGQYFTDPAVVNFMLDEIGFTKDEILKRYKNKPENESLSIIDPSCGSGTFLYSAVDRIIDALYDGSEKKSKLVEELINNNVFGLDIATFPLYLAEMSILMRMLPLIINEQYNNPIDKKIKVFETKDSIAEFVDAKIDAKEENLPLFKDIIRLGYSSFLRDEDDLREMKKSLVDVYRRRFDYVIGNPPYISYLECCNQKTLFTQLIKTKRMSMGNVYGVNLNTVPERIKTYSPKPNLYAFFSALGISLLKERGKICYIIPQTMLVNTDLDVLRYFFAKNTTIEKIITFAGKMFIGRGIKHKKPVATSSLILVLHRKKPTENHKVKIINYRNYDEPDFEKHLKSMKKETKFIEQKELLDKVNTWNFIIRDEIFLSFLELYQKSTFNINEYRNSLSHYDEVILDGSINILKKDIYNKPENKKEFKIPYLNRNKSSVDILGYYKSDVKIKKAQGSRGLLISKPKYKILWKYINFDGFYFSDKDNVLPMYQQYCLASDNRDEILYLFSILNSKLTKSFLQGMLKVENENTLTFLLGLTPFKNLVRMPIITKENQSIKIEIIKQTMSLLALENILIKDIVDFSKISLQKFEHMKIDGNNLVLLKGSENITLKIPENKTNLVSKIIAKTYFDNSVMLVKNITLSDITKLPIIDFDQQSKIKDYIDDLVFALYFNTPIQNIDIVSASSIKNLCNKNELYEYINKNC